MSLVQDLKSFYSGKRVLVTGHTGLKGSWLALWLERLGAKVTGLSLPPTSPLSNFSASGLSSLPSVIDDITRPETLRRVFQETRPEVVFHLAAQALVGPAYEDPVTTYDVNVLGTIRLLDCMRQASWPITAIMATSDKCYENVEQIWGYRETDRLGGHDPYSASKACAEIVIASFIRSYFSGDGAIRVASVRAGNVVGGGDWSSYRLIPDCIRSLRDGQKIMLRNPRSTRPWQFVLDPLAGYIMLAQRLATDGGRFVGAWNFGPSASDNNTVDRAAAQIIRHWGSGEIEKTAPTFHESVSLQLDSTKAKHYLHWRTILGFERTMELTTAWYKQQHISGDGNMRAFSLAQVEAFEAVLDEQLVRV